MGVRVFDVFQYVGFIFRERQGDVYVEMGRMDSKIYHADFSKKKIFAKYSKSDCFHPLPSLLFDISIPFIKKNP